MKKSIILTVCAVFFGVFIAAGWVMAGEKENKDLELAAAKLNANTYEQQAIQNQARLLQLRMGELQKEAPDLKTHYDSALKAAQDANAKEEAAKKPEPPKPEKKK